ncbi:hypothetical protein ACTFIY_000947 [Dictyostelium cf. discoideum]
MAHIERQNPTEKEIYAVSFDLSTPHQLGGPAYHLPANHIDKNCCTSTFYDRLNKELQKYGFNKIQKSMRQKECSLAYALDTVYTLPVTHKLTWLMHPCIDAMHLSRIITADNMAPFRYAEQQNLQVRHRKQNEDRQM